MFFTGDVRPTTSRHLTTSVSTEPQTTISFPCVLMPRKQRKYVRVNLRPNRARSTLTRPHLNTPYIHGTDTPHLIRLWTMHRNLVESMLTQGIRTDTSTTATHPGLTNDPMNNTTIDTSCLAKGRHRTLLGETWWLSSTQDQPKPSSSQMLHRAARRTPPSRPLQHSQ
ncbi:hypothetical protein CLIM01_05670 [Colletotrichum limetticola]|uniref:Uncharacterized protein n=1 Tax=Colletotrichum limetticola TaxID=1209924 RepID=A0ABQ9PZH6_9PEZI|nr:hypothetical protein CLIM01_05670 [Colletotrichum limetticola]